MFDRLELFVPDARLVSKTTPVDLHDRWVIRLMRTCADLFGGATSHGRGTGVWKSGGEYYWDRVTVIEAWADRTKSDHPQRVKALLDALEEMGRALKQEAVAWVVEGRLVVVTIQKRAS